MDSMHIAADIFKSAAGRILSGGCAVLALLASWPLAANAAPKTAVTNAPALVWPAPPNEPRIAYVRSIQGPRDFGMKRSVFRRVGGWLTGSTPETGELVKPFAVAFDEKGNLCFTDTGANAVYCFDRAEKKLLRWDEIGKIRFTAPVAVAKRGTTLYVADSALGSVVMFDVKGKFLAEIKAGLQRPVGVTVSSNRLFVVDSQAQAVLMFDLDGKPAGQFGKRGNGDGEFNFPTHITSDAAGHIFVTDSVNSRVQVFDARGKFLRKVGSMGDAPGHFSRPKGLAVDTHGHLYVLDANLDTLQLFNDKGQLLMSLGHSGSGPGEFWLSNGIAINADNEIYVADSYNRRIQVFRFIGKP